MKLLILGGTRFVGRHLVTAALARNHEITLFNRGNHPSADLTNVETIYGDRDSDLAKLQGRRWDAVVDTCGYLPRTVRASAEILSHSVDAYVFISSQSVYVDVSVPGVDESAPVKLLTSEQLNQANAIDSSGQASAATYGAMYGGLKALCEQSVEEVLPNRVLIIRPGLIVGPHDYTDRFTYWVVRVARGGEVVSQGAFLLDAETQLDPDLASAYFGADSRSRPDSRRHRGSTIGSAARRAASPFAERSRAARFLREASRACRQGHGAGED